MSKLTTIGLTGSIGMGKSTVTKMFRELGVPVWDADAAVHELYTGDAVPTVGGEFPMVITEGIVDRMKLREAIIADNAMLKRLSKLMAPLIEKHRKDWVARQTADILVFDIPLLFEVNMAEQFDFVVVVSAPAEEQRRRVMARPGMTKEAFDMILAKQMPDADKRAKADIIIDTSTSFDDTREQVLKVYQRVS